MDSIHSLSDRIQRELDEPWSRAKLIEDLSVWHKVWAACYAIGDTTLALCSYLASPDDDEVGAMLLDVYGAFQALVIQQDALVHLAKIVGLPYQRSEAIWQIRTTRIAVCGHPVESNQRQPGKRRYHTITQCGMARSRFTLGSDSEADMPAEWQDVELPKLIAIQFAHTQETLEGILKQARQLNREALRQFAGRPLLQYVTEHCPQLLDAKEQPKEALAGLQATWGTLLGEFKLRGSDHMQGLRYTLAQLEQSLRSTEPSATFTAEVQEMLNMCGEIDADCARRLRSLEAEDERLADSS